ncbi:uncharacterized protein LOC128558010 [Mercenaria mercenaria]|uniref:uncharacterized protein LOC128558010 n=1 Tax=Mercenaria mercenaria TaxID=6596 RepID=UPI00234F520B|nr:uncharacterized protein LOC128558010 [Mercenaria mercenaria]
MKMYAIFGDSYISRLNKFNHGVLYDFNKKCKFYGVPGMSTQRKFEPEFQKMMMDKPKYVFLLLGGNDINRECEVIEIVNNIEHIVKRLKNNGVERVFVSSIAARGAFPAWTRLEKTRFDKVRRAINGKLFMVYKGDFVNLEKKLKFPKHYDKDLVHPGYSEGGMKVLGYIIKTCFSKCT